MCFARRYCRPRSQRRSHRQVSHSPGARLTQEDVITVPCCSAEAPKSRVPPWACSSGLEE